MLNHSQHNFRQRTTQSDLDEIEDWTDRAARRMYEGAGLAGGVHHAKQWRLDHVRQKPELTACDTGDHQLAAITLSRVQCYVPRSTTRASTAFTP